jgi:hypothetical protein
VVCLEASGTRKPTDSLADACFRKRTYRHRDRRLSIHVEAGHFRVLEPSPQSFAISFQDWICVQADDFHAFTFLGPQEKPAVEVLGVLVTLREGFFLAAQGRDLSQVVDAMRF